MVFDPKICQVIGAAVARELRLEREKRKLSKNRTAARAGLSQQMVGYVERQMRNPTLDTLLRMAKAMEMELWPLIKKAEKEGDQLKMAGKNKIVAKRFPDVKGVKKSC